ncbi:MAG: hypothetical protein NVS4B6_27880 [Mycobacterium sp.]
MLTPAQASTDAQLVDLWLHGRSEHIQSAYCSDVARLVRLVQKPLRTVTLDEMGANPGLLGAACLAALGDASH